MGVVVFNGTRIGEDIALAERGSRASPGPAVKNWPKLQNNAAFAVLAVLFEKDSDRKLYNAYVCATRDCIIAKYRKIHPFINQNLSASEEYIV